MQNAIGVTRRKYESEASTKSYSNPDSISHHRTIDFISYSRHQIVILDRQNIPVIIPPAPVGTNFSDPRIELRIRYSFFGITNINSLKTNIEYFNNIIKGTGNDRKHIYDAVTASNYDVISKHLVVTVVRSIPERDIETARALFDESSGFLFTMENQHFCCVHPESPEGKMFIDHSDYVKSRPNGLLIEIVDNEKFIKERFTFACNRVIHIPAIIDPNRPSGIWVSEVRDVGQTTSRIENSCYTLEEASTLFGLYATIEEAQTAGNPELISKAVTQENQRTIEKLKQETERLKTEAGIDEIERKKNFQALELDLKQKVLLLENEARDRTSEMLKMKEELEKRKLARDDYYDSRHSDRKDTSEMIKFIPAVFLGFVGAAILFRK